jgi:hypothetical protein
MIHLHRFLCMRLIYYRMIVVNFLFKRDTSKLNNN